MKLGEKMYEEDITRAAEVSLPWNVLEGKNILIAGATGMLGKVVVDLLVFRNEKYGMGCNVYALGRSLQKARKRFPGRYFSYPGFHFLEWDVTTVLPAGLPEMDYVLGMAGNTHPMAYSTKPVETILTNICGTNTLLDLCRRQGSGRMVLMSSVEIYGENRGDTEFFDESYMGYIDCNTLRAGYPESKRCAESLCSAYASESGVDYVVARLPRVYGPTLQEEDSKATSQFIHKAIGGEDIILKSNGCQHYSFLYVVDAVTGILRVMLSGKAGEAYNLASPENDATLREMAEAAAGAVGRKVIQGVPNGKEKEGYSTATKARMDGAKAQSLEWRPVYGAEEALIRTIHIMEAERGAEQ